MRNLVPPRVALVCLVAGVSILGDSMLYAILPANVSSFGVAAGLVGVLLSANRWVRLASNTWAARVYTRAGLHGPMLGAVLLAITSTAGYGLARGFWPLLAFRVAWGVSYSFLRLGAFLTIMEDGSPSVRGRLMGFFNSAQRTGSVVAVVGGVLVAEALGYGRAFLIAAAIATTGLPVLLLLRRRGPLSFRPPALVAEPVRPPTTPGPRSQPASHWHHATRIRAVYATRFAIGFAMEGLVISTLGFYLRQRLGEEGHLLGLAIGVTTVTGFMLGTRWVVDLVLATPLGHLSDRLGRRRVLLAALPVMGAALVVLAVSPTIAVALAVLPFMFLAATTSVVSLDALAGDLAPVARRARVLGRYATSIDLGTASGPLLGYAVAASLGLPTMYVLAAGIIAASGALCATVLRPRLA